MSPEDRRNSADTVALILAGVVAIVVVMTAVVILYIEIINPAQDTLRAAEAVSRFTSVLIAALVGYMAGRRIGGDSGE